MSAPGQCDADSHPLDDVAPICDGCFERALSHAEPTELEPADDPAGDSDDHDDADLHPHGHAGGARRARREEDDRSVIARRTRLPA